MKANVYSHNQLIGKAEIGIIDDSMGVVGGEFTRIFTAFTANSCESLK